jgi:membrane protein
VTGTLAKLEARLFDPPPPSLGRPLAVLQLLLRYPYALARDLIVGDLNMRAMSLVYTTLLSIVPLIAFSFAIVKGLGFHREFAPLLLEFLRPLGDRADELTARVLAYVDRMQGGVLGSLGLAFLVYTVISVIQKVEASCNHIWHVERARSFGRRFSEYLSVLVVAPVMMVTALGLVATLSTQALVRWLAAHEPFGLLLVMLGRLGPLLVVSAGFAFLYAFVPNTRVRARVALGAGLAAGAVWVTASVGFTRLVAYSTQMMAVYASFAISLLGLMWIWLNWLILLTGVQFAFYLQYPQYLRSGQREVQPTARLRERLALSALVLVGQTFARGERRCTVDTLSEALAVPSSALGPVIDALETAGLVATGSAENLLLGRDPSGVTLAAVFEAVRDGAVGRGLTLRQAHLVAAAEQACDGLETAIRERFSAVTLADLIARAGPPARG